MRRTFITSSKVLPALILLACLITEGRADLGKSFNKILTQGGADVVKAVTISDANLRTATKQMMDQMDAENRVAPENDKYGKRLADLTKRLANEDGLNLNFKAYLADDVNAFATPDGSIRVFSGLMDLMTDNELRFIIGHEIGHVKLGHSLKQARTAYLSSAAAKVANAQSGLNSQQLTEVAEKFVNAQFSQSQEMESDAYGVKFLRRHKYNLPAAESSMRKLVDLAGKSGGRTSSLFSSHPDAKKRADKIHQLITKK